MRIVIIIFSCPYVFLSLFFLEAYVDFLCLGRARMSGCEVVGFVSFGFF